MNSRILKISAALLMVALLAVPAFAAARGKADFTRFVTLGDSTTLGVSNLATVFTHQKYSWAAQFARQVGLKTDCTTDGPGCFQQAYISEPGILPEMVLTSISPFGYMIKPGAGAPLNSGLGRPYNNLAVDGAEVADALGIGLGEGNEKYSAPIVLRGLGSPVEQAAMLHPTFVGVWLGSDDFFGPLQAGNPAGLTSVDSFVTDYGKVLDGLIAGATSDAGFVVANLPADVRKIPLVNVLPIVLVDPSTGQPVKNPATGQNIPLIADLGGGNFGPLPAGSAVLFTAAGDLQTGYGIPAQLAPLLPPLPNIGKPLPDADVLTPTEIDAFNARIAQYNSAISSAAAARNIPVVDINALFERFAKGVTVGPINLSLAYISGGLISLDSGHPTDIGYTLITNEFIKTVNAAYGTKIPFVSLSQFLVNNAAGSKLPFFTGNPWEISSETVKALTTMRDAALAPATPAPRRYRATGH